MSEIQKEHQPEIIENQPEAKVQPEAKSKKKSGFRKLFKFTVFTAIFVFTIVAVFSSQALISQQSTDSWFYKLPIISQIKQLAESAEAQLKGEDRDRINILLLGIGGKNHDGGNLTDTIILASLEPSTKKASMISIPRDLAIPVENMGWKKINSINAYAEMNQAGSGGMAISQALSDILETPIDYYFRVDFKAFTQMIDELGGIDVYVENTLDDYAYPVHGREDDPNYNSRYEHLHVDTGWQKMDGELALKFVRSRHGINGEGSDFARARRQQSVILAVREKVLSAKTIFKPNMIANIIANFQENISTNLKVWEMIKLWNMFGDISKEQVANKVMDNSPNGLLVNSVSDQGAYILSPRSGDFTEIKYFVNHIFDEGPQDQKVKVAEERATLEVRNGTWVNGLASQTATDLEKLGFIVVNISNSDQQNFQKSVIYDLTYGEKAQSLSVLKEATGANVSLGLPDWLIEEISKDVSAEKDPVKPDFILILGQDADKSGSGTENAGQ